MSKSILLFVLFNILLLVSCTTLSAVEPSLQPTATLLKTTDSPTPISTSTKIPLPMPSTITPIATIQQTDTPSATVTPMITPMIKFQTLSFEAEMPINIGIEGILVIDRIDNNDTDYLLNLSNGERNLLDTSNDSDVLFADWTWPIVSPNGKWLAYLEQSYEPLKRNLRVVSSSGEQQTILNWPDDWSGDILGWVNDESLSFTKLFNEEAVVEIYNFMNGEWQTIEPTFPLISQNGEIIGGLASPGLPILIYNPQLTRVVLERYSEKDDRDTYELWDIATQNLLWEKSTGLFSSRPVWSPDGKHFAITCDEYESNYPLDADLTRASLYIVSSEGVETKLADRVAGAVSWSPDGQHLATWFHGATDFDTEIPEWERHFLATVNADNQHITVFSVGSASTGAYPIWSQDGSMIALFSSREPDDNEDIYNPTHIVIVDFAHKKVFEIEREAIIRGWMVNP